MVANTRIKFHGCCALLGPLSDGIPNGLTKRFRISHDEMIKRIDSLVNMPVNATPCLTKHGNPVGFIHKVKVTNTEVLVWGCVWSAWLKDSAVIDLIRFGEAGMSLEFLQATFQRQYLTDFTLNGVAIVQREKAAFQRTWVKLNAR